MKPIILANVREYNLLCWKENNRHDRRLARLKSALKDSQKLCPHKETSFQEDPSGGNDSYYYCDACDKVISGPTWLK